MRLQDTLTGSLLELPDPPEPIGIYVCGPTVYARAHIGNARPFVVFTWLAAWLRARGHQVWLVHNITDVNDKIYAAAAERGVPSARHAEEMIAAYVADTDALERYQVHPAHQEAAAFVRSVVTERAVVDYPF